jgi:hypothetical protein
MYFLRSPPCHRYLSYARLFVLIAHRRVFCFACRRACISRPAPCVCVTLCTARASLVCGRLAPSLECTWCVGVGSCAVVCVGVQEYLDICEKEGVPDKEARQLLAALHTVGAALHFDDHPVLRNYVFLHPAFVMDAVFKSYGLPGPSESHLAELVSWGGATSPLWWPAVAARARHCGVLCAPCRPPLLSPEPPPPPYVSFLPRHSSHLAACPPSPPPPSPLRLCLCLCLRRRRQRKAKESELATLRAQLDEKLKIRGAIVANGDAWATAVSGGVNGEGGGRARFPRLGQLAVGARCNARPRAVRVQSQPLLACCLVWCAGWGWVVG